MERRGGKKTKPEHNQVCYRPRPAGIADTASKAAACAMCSLFALWYDILLQLLYFKSGVLKGGGKVSVFAEEKHIGVW